jgi:carbon-monoxide dehydrogenase medium subunit
MTTQPVMHRPGSEEELLALLARHGDDAKVVAGGTAFMILWKAGLLRPGHVASASRVPGLSSVHAAADGTAITIGALARLRDVERDPQVRRRLPVLAATLRVVANVRVRNVATMGGNMAEADPTSDPPAVLAALDAQVEVVRSSGVRRLPYREFVRDYFETALEADELVRRVVVPVLPGWTGSYVKFLSRSGEDRTCLGVAAFVATEDGGVLSGLRVAVTGAGPVPLRLPQVEEQVPGHAPGECIPDVAAAYAAAADPVSDVRGSAEYRRQVLPALVERAVRRAAAGFDDAVLA